MFNFWVKNLTFGTEVFMFLGSYGEAAVLLKAEFLEEAKLYCFNSTTQAHDQLPLQTMALHSRSILPD